MKCQICENPATVHLTDIVNKKKRELHLCEQCARERNLIPEPPGPQIDLKALMGLLTSPFPQGNTVPGATGPAAEPVATTCEVCGMTLKAGMWVGWDFGTFNIQHSTPNIEWQPPRLRGLLNVEC